MMTYQRYTQRVGVFGPFVDGDGDPIEDLPDQSANGYILKGGVYAPFAAASWTHGAQGHYLVGLTAAHHDTLGFVRIQFSAEGVYLPVWEDYEVVAGPPVPTKMGLGRNMEPFDDAMWPDAMHLIRVRRGRSGGSEQKYYDATPSEEFVCRARSRSITLQDGRTVTVWDVRTPVNPMIDMDDMIMVVDPSGGLRKLVAEGPSVPKAEGYSYLTECAEKT